MLESVMNALYFQQCVLIEEALRRAETSVDGF